MHTILIVEDNPVTRKMVRVTLETDGYRVQEAEDGRTALDLAKQYPPDLILQDLLLPDIGGFELLRQLRSLPGGAEIPILAFSGALVSKTEPGRNLHTGFDDYLFKPIEPSQLLQIVRTYLRPGGSAGEPGRGWRILVAHDDPVHLKLLRTRLEVLGFRVTTARDGAEAFETARSSPPDAILADVLMPRMDGFRLSLAVRLHPQLARVPVVLISAAFVEQADRDLAQTVGANALLTCPPDSREAIQTLLANLGKAPPLPEQPVELTEEYTHRLIRQLERQVAYNASLTQRLALREAEISVLAGLADTLEGTPGMQTILTELLHRSLDAAGVSKGSVYFVEPDGRLALRAQIGYAAGMAPAVEGFFGCADLLDRAIEDREAIVVPSEAVSQEQAEDLLVKSDATSIVIAPLVFAEECLGVLAMISVNRDIGADWIPFAKAVGAEIGQSVRLARTLSLLKDHEEKLARIVDTMTDGLLISDAQNRITFANAAAGKLLGTPHEAMIGSTCDGSDGAAWRTTTLDGRPYASQESPCQRVLKTAQPVYDVEQVVLRPDGMRLILSVNAAPLLDTEGAVAGVVRSLRDISGRKQAEQTLAEQANDLRQYSAELEQFAYVAAHDLQEPLRTVASFTQLLAQRYRGKLDAEADKFIDIVVSGAKRMRSLIDDLLAYSRVIRRGSEFRTTDCDAVFQQCMESLRAAVEEAGAQVSCDPLPTLSGDRLRLSQLLQNLIGNALKFRSSEPPRIHVSSALQGGEWLFSVRDNGIGIDPQYSERIFQVFERLHGKTEYTGTGIGLAICKRIVELHHGRIWVESEPRKGATFYFTIPNGEKAVKTPSGAPAAQESFSAGPK